jgi:hypothetical protein
VAGGPAGERDSLEKLFVRVTAQDDYRPVARRILDLVAQA